MNFNYSGVYYTYNGYKNEQIQKLVFYKNKSSLFISDILLGKLSKKIAGDNAYIVDLGRYGTAFLSANNTSTILEDQFKLGENYLVQVSQLDRGKKLPKVRADISLNSDNFVILTDKPKIVFSSKIDDVNFKDNLRTRIADLVGDNCGVLVRTSAVNKDLDLLMSELESLYSKYDLILASKNRILKDKLLYRSVDISDENINLDSINNNVLTSYIKGLISSEIYIDKKVRVMIEPTQALIAVDIDTSSLDDRYVSGEEFIYNLNYKILPSILLELYNRNFSGIIIIDLLKMNHYNKKRFMREISKYKDMFSEMRFDIKGFTRLGLFEMTRQRRHPSVIESFASSETKQILNYECQIDMALLEIISDAKHLRYMLEITIKYKDNFIRDKKVIRDFLGLNARKLYYKFSDVDRIFYNYTDSVFQEESELLCIY